MRARPSDGSRSPAHQVFAKPPEMRGQSTSTGSGDAFGSGAGSRSASSPPASTSRSYLMGGEVSVSREGYTESPPPMTPAAALRLSEGFGYGLDLKLRVMKMCLTPSHDFLDFPDWRHGPEFLRLRPLHLPGLDRDGLPGTGLVQLAVPSEGSRTQDVKAEGPEAMAVGEGRIHNQRVPLTRLDPAPRSCTSRSGCRHPWACSVV